MAQYIDKEKIVAEIERRINEIDEFGTYLSPKGTLTNLLCHLNTLEVKEVDLEKEFDNFRQLRFDFEDYERNSLQISTCDHLEGT